MNEGHKSPVDQALALFVYAPIGLALAAAEELPKLVEKGRDVVASRASMYRMVGKYAVDKGQATAERLMRNRPPEPTRPGPGPVPDRPAPAPPEATGAAAPTESGNGQRPPAPSSDD